jgi:hypothetical protein
MLPWWLTHHRQYFNHGIMIDYHSTDNSVNIIKTLCPSWDIITSQNKIFNPIPVDEEVSLIEQNLSGWRVCLNVPEFLVGNYSRLSDSSVPTNIYVDTITFIESKSKENPTILDPTVDLIKQCSWVAPRGFRSQRSVHNYPINYPPGRHFYSLPTYKDLMIYYYGWASLEPASIKRRMQIQTKTQVDPMSPHLFTEEQLLEKFKDLQKTASFYNIL